MAELAAAPLLEMLAWHKAPKGYALAHPPREQNFYTAFRATFEVPSGGGGEYSVRLFGAHWFRVWLDGEPLTEGPARFYPEHPEAEQLAVRLEAGEHVLAALVHHEGVSMRNQHQPPVPAFFAADVRQGLEGQALSARWKCLGLEAYAHRDLRISPNLGWVEWCDLRLLLKGWTGREFDDGAWEVPVLTEPPLGALTALDGEVPRLRAIAAGRLAGQGGLAESSFNLYPENVAWGFALREPVSAEHGARAEGCWFLFDLGRTHLVAPRVRLRVPAGTHVEVAYAERLCSGHVKPVIFLSNGSSCNLDHFIATGDAAGDWIEPVTPKGGRFIEVHVSAPPEKCELVSAEFFERCSLPAQPRASFACDDAELERVWAAGYATLLGCAEDALVDCVHRERGQWTGDTVTVGLELCSATTGDLRLIKRCLRQCAQGARAADGLVPARCPGNLEYHSGYALLWSAACWRYFQHTGDGALLRELWGAAWRNIGVYQQAWRGAEAGLDIAKINASQFTDWGYGVAAGEPDFALHFQYLEACETLAEWARHLGHGAQAEALEQAAAEVKACATRWLAERLEGAPAGAAGARWWLDRIGYHGAVLALRAGVLSDAAEAMAVAAIEQHLAACFPNNPDGVRLRQPQVASRQLITPYFAHFTFPELFKRGRGAVALQQMRHCWGGYLLGEGRTTFAELFDLDWSHCHHWSAGPTWQSSRFGLGLFPREDLGRDCFEFGLRTGGLQRAEGMVPLRAAGGAVEVARVAWQQEGGHIEWRIETPRPLTLVGVAATPVQVEGAWLIRLTAADWQ